MKRKNVMFITALCAAVMLGGMAYMRWMKSKTNETPSVPEQPRMEWKLQLSPPERTPEEQERWVKNGKLRSAIGNIHMQSGTWFYTFGQASKLCDLVVVGTVEEVRALGTTIVLALDACLYGRPAGKKMTFEIPDGSSWIPNLEQRLAKPGDKILVFLTNKDYDVWSLFFSVWPSQNLYSFDFDRAKAKRSGSAEAYSIWSYIILDSKEAEEEAVRMAQGYLKIFGGKGTRDRDTYIEFLCSLLNSPVQRIRDDAESDLLLFYERELSPDLDKLLADDRVRQEIKDYLRFRLCNEKPNEEQK